MPNRKQKYDWATKASELRSQPGVWGVVVKSGEAPNARAAQSVTRYIRKGKSPHMPSGEFDAVTRGDEVFAIYVGNPN